MLHWLSQSLKGCPKDEFPLPNINMLVDATIGRSMFSFMDEFNGYNQIRMDSFDTKKTTFRTLLGNFYLNGHAIQP